LLGRGSGSSDTYTIGGTVSGLTGTGLVLQNNGGDDLTIYSIVTFVFTTALTDGSGYVATVLSDPTTPSQTCTVSSVSGTLGGTDVSSVSVDCIDSFTEYVYVSNTDDDTVSVINTETNAVVATIDVGDNPRGLDGTPNGQLVFVANRGDDTVSVINTGNNTVTKTISLTGEQPYNLEVTPDGSNVYVVMKTYESGYGDLGTVSIIDVSTLTETSNKTLVGESSEGIAISPDGFSVYAVSRGSGTIDLINTSNNVVTEFVSTSGYGPRDAMVIGSKAYTTTQSTTLEVINVTTEALVISIGLTGSGSYGVSVNFDGSRAYVSMGWSDTVVVVDLENEVETGSPISIGDEPHHIKVVQVPD
jgi:YVTN family beta-propeller protein